MTTGTDVMTQASQRSWLSPLGFGLRTAAMWATVLVSFSVASQIIPVQLPVPPQDGPLSVMGAFLVVNGLIAFALSLVAANARVKGWRLAVLLFVAFFAIGSAIMQIETLYFNESIKMPVPVIIALVEQAALVAAVTGIVGALLFHPDAEDASPVPSHMTARVALMAVIYLGLYYAAGYFIAWQSEAVRAYYGNGVHIELLPTVALQLFRGTLFALVSLFVLTRMQGSLAGRALIMAVLFCVLTAAQLLYPNPMLPWAVRSAHLVEVASSEFLYGLIVTLVLLSGAVRHPLADRSPWRLIAGRA